MNQFLHNKSLKTILNYKKLKNYNQLLLRSLKYHYMEDIYALNPQKGIVRIQNIIQIRQINQSSDLMSNLRQEHNQSRMSERQEYSQKNNRSLNHLDPQQLQRQINSLQNQIQFTIANYEAILQTQKKNTNQRNQFLLYLIQSMKTKHNQQIESYRSELQNVLQQKQQAHTLESQMKNIGEGVDSILQQGKRLKQTNQALLKQYSEQQSKQKEIDQQIESYSQQIQSLRQQIDQWEKTKLKWNRKKKDMISLIDQTQRKVKSKQKSCAETGLQQENCEHCQHKQMDMLMNKYKVNLN